MVTQEQAEGRVEDSRATAIVYCEGEFGGMDGKTANGLVRYSNRYRIVAVIDSTKVNRDAGTVLGDAPSGIPICRDLSHALERQQRAPEYFIFGMAPLGGIFSEPQRQLMFRAMENGMHLVNGLHEFLGDDETFVRKAQACGVGISDVRKPKATKDLRVFNGGIFDVACPIIAVLGTDSAVGKRTTSTLLTRALQKRGLNAVLVATGQTGLIQGAKYGVALDSIPEQFISGEMESAVVAAYEGEDPDVLIIEGQGALSHPAYLSSCFIIRGSRPNAIILQHAPHRKMLGDYPRLPMPSVESEIKLIEVFSGAKVVAIAINHERMTEGEVEAAADRYEAQHGVPATDVLLHGTDKLVQAVLSAFPELQRTRPAVATARQAGDGSVAAGPHLTSIPPQPAG